MKGSIRKKLVILLGISAILCVMIGLLAHLRSGKPVPAEPAAAGKRCIRPEPRVSFVVGDAVGQSAAERLGPQNTSDKAESAAVDVFGVIRDEKGNAMAGALVRALQIESGAKRYDATATTGSDGMYTLKGLHINSPFLYKIIASAPGYAATYSEDFALGRNSREVNITLLKGVSLSGRIKAESGEGIGGATLSLIDSSMAIGYWIGYYADFENVLTVTTDSEGEYSFPNVLQGEYWLYAQAQNYFDSRRLLSISSEDISLKEDFVLDYAGDDYFAGIVVDEQSGEPIEGVRIECRSGSPTQNLHRVCYTSSEGKFSLRGFPKGSTPGIAFAYKPGYTRKGLYRFKDFGEPHDLRIPLKAEFWGSSRNTVSGRVFNNDSSKPVSKFSIAILRKNEDAFFFGHQSYCAYAQIFDSSDGTFTIPAIRQGRVSLMVIAAGCSTTIVPFFVYPKAVPEEMREALRKGGRESSLENFIEIPLEPGATVTGSVYDLRTGDPLPGAKVCLDYDREKNTFGPISLSAFADELGRYTLEGVPEGLQCLVASHPGYGPAYSGEIQFQKQKVYDELDFSLGSGASVEGKVLDSYNLQDGVEIVFQPVDSPDLYQNVGGSSYKNRFFGPSRIAQTDAEGRYRIDMLPPGYCLARTHFVSGDGKRDRFVDVTEVIETVEGETTTFDIPACGGTISGIILFDESFRPDLEKGTGYFALLREAGAPPIDLSEGDRPVIKAPIRHTMNNKSSKGWSFNFSGVCAGEYTITVLPYERGERQYYKFVDQKSVPVKIRSYGNADKTIDFRKGRVFSMLHDLWRRD